MDKELKNLVYGKNDLEGIVSVEPDGKGQCEIFIEKAGKLTTKIVPNEFFILFDHHYNGSFKALKGNQFYSYAKSYKDKDLYEKAMKKCYNKGYDVFTIRDTKESFMSRYGYTYYKGIDIEDVSILSIDIEDTYGIAEECDPNGKLLSIANTYCVGKTIKKKLFAYDEYVSEAAMLKAWSKWFVDMNPSILVGHNVYGHDFKVIDFAAKRFGVKLKLGRNGSEMQVNHRESLFRKDMSQSYSYRNIRIYGREIVDTWFLAMKYDASSRREYENYKLKYIIAHEGLEKKGRVHFDASQIKKLYKIPKEWAKIKEYNKDDSDDALNYFKLAAGTFFYYARSCPRSFQSIINSASGGQINSIMVRSYLQKGYSIAKATTTDGYKGAISFGVPGIHKNVFKIDVASLYPSIILTYKIYDKRKDPLGHGLKILQYFTEQRLKNKKLYKETNKIIYKILSDSQKVNVCNSMYGFWGSKKSNYNYPKGASRVTKEGRERLLDAIEWATGKRQVPEGAFGAGVNNEED